MSIIKPIIHKTTAIDHATDILIPLPFDSGSDGVFL
jgi:hypothetical protein